MCGCSVFQCSNTRHLGLHHNALNNVTIFYIFVIYVGPFWVGELYLVQIIVWVIQVGVSILLWSLADNCSEFYFVLHP